MSGAAHRFSLRTSTAQSSPVSGSAARRRADSGSTPITVTRQPRSVEQVPVQEGEEVLAPSLGQNGPVEAHPLARPVEVVRAQAGPGDVQRELDLPVRRSGQLVQALGQAARVPGTQHLCGGGLERAGVLRIHTPHRPPAARVRRRPGENPTPARRHAGTPDTGPGRGAGSAPSRETPWAARRVEGRGRRYVASPAPVTMRTRVSTSSPAVVCHLSGSRWPLSSKPAMPWALVSSRAP